MYDFQRKHGHDINCHVLARASRCITIRASVVLNGASTCSNTCASACITTRARLLFKNMHPGQVKHREPYGARKGATSEPEMRLCFIFLL